MKNLLPNHVLLTLLVMALLMDGSVRARNYVVVAPSYVGTSYLFDMSEDGELNYRKSIYSGDGPSVDVSYDNRLVVITGSWDVTSLFFNDMGFDLAVRNWWTPSYYIIDTSMHPTKHRFYVGPVYNISSFGYNVDTLTINHICTSTQLTTSAYLVYSLYSNTVYFNTYEGDPAVSGRGLQGMKLKGDDSFDTLTTKTSMGRVANSGLYISHDGKTLVSCSHALPQVKVYRVQQDGNLRFVQDWNVLGDYGNNPTALFSPDDKYVYIVANGYPYPYGGIEHGRMCSSYALDPDTSALTEIQIIRMDTWRDEYGSIVINANTSSISPDGRFILIPHLKLFPDSQYYSQFGVIRLYGPTMVPLPIQPLILDDYINASGIAVFNTNATEPTWAQYE